MQTIILAILLLMLALWIFDGFINAVVLPTLEAIILPPLNFIYEKINGK
jgi:hypothetical protein